MNIKHILRFYRNATDTTPTSRALLRAQCALGILSIALAGAFSSTAASAQASSQPSTVVYKIVDANGRVTYTNTPVKGAQVVELQPLTIVPGLPPATRTAPAPTQAAAPATPSAPAATAPVSAPIAPIAQAPQPLPQARAISPPPPAPAPVLVPVAPVMPSIARANDSASIESSTPRMLASGSGSSTLSSSATAPSAVAIPAGFQLIQPSQNRARSEAIVNEAAARAAAENPVENNAPASAPTNPQIRFSSVPSQPQAVIEPTPAAVAPIAAVQPEVIAPVVAAPKVAIVTSKPYLAPNKRESVATNPSVDAFAMAEQRREDVRRRIIEGEIEAEQQLLVDAKQALNAERAKSDEIRALRASIVKQTPANAKSSEMLAAKTAVTGHFERVRSLEDHVMMHQRNIADLEEQLKSGPATLTRAKVGGKQANSGGVLKPISTTGTR